MQYWRAWSKVTERWMEQRGLPPTIHAQNPDDDGATFCNIRYGNYWEFAPPFDGDKLDISCKRCLAKIKRMQSEQAAEAEGIM